MRGADCDAGLSPAELDAHRQVLEMARTIEALQQDFARVQEELSAAYAQLSERSAGRRGEEREGPSPRRRWAVEDGGGRCCSHEQEAQELKKVRGCSVNGGRQCGR